MENCGDQVETAQDFAALTLAQRRFCAREIAFLALALCAYFFLPFSKASRALCPSAVNTPSTRARSFRSFFRSFWNFATTPDMFTGAAYNERFCASSADILDRERGRGLVTLAPPSEIGPDVVALMHNYSHQTKNYYQDQSGL
jgi:hypothetical protein